MHLDLTQAVAETVAQAVAQVVVVPLALALVVEVDAVKLSKR